MPAVCRPERRTRRRSDAEDHRQLAFMGVALEEGGCGSHAGCANGREALGTSLGPPLRGAGRAPASLVEALGTLAAGSRCFCCGEPLVEVPGPGRSGTDRSLRCTACSAEVHRVSRS